MHKIINYYPLGNNLASARTLRNVARIAKSQAISMYYRANNYTPIVKDPLAIFSADWLSKTFDMNVLVMIRHPAAFCSSLKLKGWKHNFSHFLKQPLLMKQYLQKFEADISEFAAREQDIISQAILLWNCIHHTINIYQEKHPEWIFAKHEELSSDPLTEFQKIFDAFNLELTPSAKTYILDSSGAHNPTEQKSGEEFIRNSKANIFNWKNRLTETEIQRIYAGTLEISKLFYAENDWK
ncbi:MAG: sulfotransferase [Candidatus Thioglobus sp.]|nr:sulfotransferase [Candidatus Thioglobus sp.]